MRRVTLKEIVPLKAYDQQHDDRRRSIIQAKSDRRVSVGRFLTFVFENRDTVLFQIQEMLRVERISEPEKVQFEIDTYNELIPRDNELSATLFIEIDSPVERKKTLPLLVGIEKAVTLRRGDAVLSTAERIQGFVPEEVERPDYASSIYFLRFPLNDKVLRDAFLKTDTPIWLSVDHPHCGASERISANVLGSLRNDLAESAKA